MKTSRKYCTCHTKRLSTRSRTRLNVTKCHACHAKRSNDTSETSKNDHLCRTSHRHGHMVLARTVALANATSSEHTLNPQTPRVKREPLLRIREKSMRNQLFRLGHGFNSYVNVYQAGYPMPSATSSPPGPACVTYAKPAPVMCSSVPPAVEPWCGSTWTTEVSDNFLVEKPTETSDSTSKKS